MKKSQQPVPLVKDSATAGLATCANCDRGFRHVNERWHP